LKVRKMMRKLGGARPVESAVTAYAANGDGHACVNGAIQAHNAQLLNDGARTNGSAKPADEAHV